VHYAGRKLGDNLVASNGVFVYEAPGESEVRAHTNLPFLASNGVRFIENLDAILVTT
jgi:hypothetical protein